LPSSIHIIAYLHWSTVYHRKQLASLLLLLFTSRQSEWRTSGEKHIIFESVLMLLNKNYQN